ncbi:MAG: hypothetical protein OXG35_12875 [Acidobacteria bacterium]|nr:hypothetical protein [Acidobacteriota bacterium]
MPAARTATDHKAKQRRCASCGADIAELPTHFRYCRTCYPKAKARTKASTVGPRADGLDQAERQCGCGADITHLPAHFRYCDDCHDALKGEARYPDEDFWDGDMHRLLTGVD